MLDREKMKKKLLGLVLAFCLSYSTIVPAYATEQADSNPQEESLLSRDSVSLSYLDNDKEDSADTIDKKGELVEEESQTDANEAMNDSSDSPDNSTSLVEDINVARTPDSKRIISEGTYSLRSSLDFEYVVDTAYASADNGAAILLWHDGQNMWQKYKIVYDEQGYCTLFNLVTGGVLDVRGASSTPGSPIVQWEYNGGDNQKWEIVAVREGIYSFISKQSGLAMSVKSETAANGVLLCADRRDADFFGQGFKLDQMIIPESKRTVADGVYSIASFEDKSKVLSIEDDLSGNGANLNIQTDEQRGGQKFNVSWRAGYYEIVCVGSSKNIDVENASTKLGANVLQWERNEGLNQKWIITQNDDGSISITSPMNGYCLDLAWGSIEDGTNVQLWAANNGPNQKFVFDTTAPLEDGFYSISTSLNRSKTLDVVGGSTVDGTLVNLWQNNKQPWQKFELKYFDDGTYSIKSMNSLKSLSVSENPQPGEQVCLSSETESDKSRWTLFQQGDGTWSIVSVNSGMYLDVSWANAIDGQVVDVWPDNGQLNQRFIFSKVNVMEDGYYSLPSYIDPSFVLDVENASKANGANIGLWNSTGKDWQKFYLTNFSDGSVSLSSFQSDKVIDVELASSFPGANVLQWQFTGADNQLWNLAPAGNNSYSLKSKQTGLVLGVDGCNAYAGANVTVDVSNGGDSQKFLFVKVPTFKVYLDAGHGADGDGAGTFDVGALGCGYTEYGLTVELVDLIDSVLKNKYDIKTFKNTDGGWYVLRHGEAIAEKCSTLVSIHFNASTSSFATGTESYIHSYNAAPGSSVLQQIIHPYLVKSTGLYDRGMKRAELAVCGGKLPAILCEVGFITNSSDIASYEAKKVAIAVSIADGIAEASQNPVIAYTY